MKGLEMKRRANLLCKVVITALLALTVGSFVAPGTLHAQGAIGQVKRDPTGATTGTATDVPGKDPKNPTLAAEIDTARHNQLAINSVWTLVAGVLVKFMAAASVHVRTH